MLLYDRRAGCGTGATAGRAVGCGCTLADLGGTRADALEVSWQWQRDGYSVIAMGIQRVALAVAWTAGTVRAGDPSVTGEFVAVLNAQRTRLTGLRVVRGQPYSGAQVARWPTVPFALAFEVGCNSGTKLVRAAVNATGARRRHYRNVDYVIDPGEPPADKRNTNTTTLPCRQAPPRCGSATGMAAAL
jgi:hypothetical protein